MVRTSHLQLEGHDFGFRLFHFT